MSRQTPSQRLLERLKAMGVPLAEDATIERTYAGRGMRSAGAWVWHSGPASEGHFMVGSIFPVTDLVRRPLLCATLSQHAPEWSVWPYDDRDWSNPVEQTLNEEA
jgi:hypothetical protein